MTEFNTLLTANAKPQEKALERACGHLANVDVPIKHLWDPMKCPLSLLPWLAWALSVDEWDSAWPESIQRQVIADSIPVHQMKGTIGAIRKALSGLKAHMQLTEWQENGGAPFTAELTALARDNLNANGDTLLTPELMAQLWRVVAATKPARTHIYFSVGVQQDGPVAVAGGGSSTVIRSQKFDTVINNALSNSTLSTGAGAEATTVCRAMMSVAPVNALLASSTAALAAHSLTTNTTKMVLV